LQVLTARSAPRSGHSERGEPAAGVEAAEWRRAREHYLRYLELAGAGRLAEAGQELEKLGQALGIARDTRSTGGRR
jgi:hypothetical protein